MALLDHGLQRPADADAVAAHDHEPALLLVVGVGRAELLAVFRAQLEDVADLDRAADLERLARLRARLALAHAAEVAEPRDGEVARDVDIAQVEAVAVGAGDAVADEADRMVGEDAGERAGSLIVPRTAPRLPGFAPMTGPISSGVAGRHRLKPSAPSLASSSSSPPRSTTAKSLPSPT